MKTVKIIFVLIAILMLSGCGNSANKDTKYKTGEEIKLKSVVGSGMTLIRKNKGFVIKGMEEKIIIFDIFGTFCPPCKEEAPSLMNFQINNKDVIIIGLTHMEDVTDEYVVENFASKYNAYYFITNSDENLKIIDTITEDIDYPSAVSLPLKVVIKDGKYQDITSMLDSSKMGKFYLGKVNIELMQKDIDRIKNK